MKQTNFLKDFRTFTSGLTENKSDEAQTINDVKNKLKEKYGKTPQVFIQSIKEKGWEDLRNFTMSILPKNLNNIKGRDNYLMNFDKILSGILSFFILDNEMEKDK